MPEHQCTNPTMYRYTWPGKDEARTCLIHGMQLTRIAAAMGMHLQLIPLEPEEVGKDQCAQRVKDK